MAAVSVTDKPNVKIVVIGATGTIGKHVVQQLKQHAKDISDECEIQIIETSRKSEVGVDISKIETITKLFTSVKSIDHVVCVTGGAYVGPVPQPGKVRETLDDQFHKVWGQMEVASHAFEYLNDGGSVTLTSGVLTDVYYKQTTFLGAANAAVDAFVKGSACSAPRGIRINVVSPGLCTETIPVFGKFMPGYPTIDAKDVAGGYVESVFSGVTGKVIQRF